MFAYFRLMRPQQWVKNLFVFLGVFFAGELLTPRTIDALFVFIAFCLAASMIYVINDLKDVDHDRLHPKKRHRPIASGEVSTAGAASLAAILLILLIAVAVSFLSVASVAVIITYILFNIVYTLLLKNIVIIDAFSIAFGFVLRVLAGTVGIGQAPSSWMFVTVIALSLFLAFAKRLHEKRTVGKGRTVLQNYTETFLQQSTVVSALLAMVFYALYVAEAKSDLIHFLSIPFVLFGFFRYLYIVEVRDGGGDPTEQLFRDPWLLATVIVWGLLLFFGVTP